MNVYAIRIPVSFASNKCARVRSTATDMDLPS